MLACCRTDDQGKYGHAHYGRHKQPTSRVARDNLLQLEWVGNRAPHKTIHMFQILLTWRSSNATWHATYPFACQLAGTCLNRNCVLYETNTFEFNVQARRAMPMSQPTNSENNNASTRTGHLPIRQADGSMWKRTPLVEIGAVAATCSLQVGTPCTLLLLVRVAASPTSNHNSRKGSSTRST